MAEGAEHASRKPRREHPRHSFRARSHASAHAGVERKAPAIPDHPLIPKNSPVLLDEPAALAELVAELQRARSFAYDSEFIGERSYHPQLCLIQVATGERVALIDALAELDLTEFWELVADGSIEKVVHAGQQDLEPVFRHLRRPPANIFDTQVAAGFAGLAYPSGLSKLVRELVGVQLGKGFTFTNWDHRPLTAVQVRYAADDVRYLPALREALGARLEGLGHMEWVKEECAALCDPELYLHDPESDYLRLRGVGSLTRRGAAILRELFTWREEAARRHDSPPRAYLKDDVLLELARSPAGDLESLAKVRGLPRPVREMEGPLILGAVERGKAVPEVEWPVVAQVEESPGERFAADGLWSTVQAWCHGQSVDPAVVTSRQEIARLLRDPPRHAEARVLRGWRRELLGEVLQDFVKGQRVLKLQYRSGAVRSESDGRGRG